MSSLGLFNSSNYRPEQVQGQAFAGQIITKMPQGTAPLLGFTSLLPKAGTNTPEYTWKIRGPIFTYGVLTTGIAACARGNVSVLAVDDAGKFVVGDILQVNGSQEHVRVVGSNGQFALSVERGFGTLPPQPIASGTQIWRVGTAFEESSLRPQAHNLTGDKPLTNLTQIFRDTWGVSGTVAATKLVGVEASSPMADSRMGGMANHAQNLEMTMIFGQQYQGTRNGQPLRKMDGILSMLRKHAPSRVHMAPSVMTFRMFEKMLNPMFDFTSDQANANDRILFVGNAGMQIINDFGNFYGQKWLENGQTAFGHRFRSFITSRGSFNVVEHPLFNVNPDWARMILAVDLTSMRTRYLAGRDTRPRTFNKSVNGLAELNTADNGIDAEGGDFLTEMTLELGLPEANSVIYGVCSAACEPCPTLPTTYDAALGIDFPCSDGPVVGGTTVTITLTGNKAAQVYKIATPSGVVNLTAGGGGSGSITYVLPAYVDSLTSGMADVYGHANEYTFSVVNDPSLSNVNIAQAVVTACVSDPCDLIAGQSNDPNCPVICNTAP